MLPDRVSNPGHLTYESGALPIALRGPALLGQALIISNAFLSICTCISRNKCRYPEKREH